MLEVLLGVYGECRGMVIIKVQATASPVRVPAGAARRTPVGVAA